MFLFNQIILFFDKHGMEMSMILLMLTVVDTLLALIARNKNGNHFLSHKLASGFFVNFVFSMVPAVVYAFDVGLEMLHGNTTSGTDLMVIAQLLPFIVYFIVSASSIVAWIRILVPETTNIIWKIISYILPNLGGEVAKKLNEMSKEKTND
ncbi:hypothetical protein [Pseudolactococcus insecticola]|uniref:Uncharacterized protein n=1 Tax=Pseudolactococcus insecticola TaxID=2709158 RepID=A0A6A0B5R5_9LACT|nr:hypothetical protein [Lactococcus insecticola]GFH39858.1 hypothetical protein Hs20B_02560 [Lactococcus insecticola]